MRIDSQKDKIRTLRKEYDALAYYQFEGKVVLKPSFEEWLKGEDLLEDE